MQRHFFPTLHPLSLIIFATATMVAFVLFRNYRFNFHCYTQHEATLTASFVKGYKGHSLMQTSFTELPNSLSKKLLLVARHILTMGLQKCL